MGSLFVFWGSRGIIQPLEEVKAFFAAFCLAGRLWLLPQAFAAGENLSFVFAK